MNRLHVVLWLDCVVVLCCVRDVAGLAIVREKLEESDDVIRTEIFELNSNSIRERTRRNAVF